MFRETMVRNFTRDMALWASTAGLPANRYYSHQIPADYLYDTRPSDYANNANNPRYYSSASPLWTADIAPYGSAGRDDLRHQVPRGHPPLRVRPDDVLDPPRDPGPLVQLGDHGV